MYVHKFHETFACKFGGGTPKQAAPDSSRQLQAAPNSSRQLQTAPVVQTAPDSSIQLQTAPYSSRQPKAAPGRSRQLETAPDNSRQPQKAPRCRICKFAPILEIWTLSRGLTMTALEETIPDSHHTELRNWTCMSGSPSACGVVKASPQTPHLCRL